MEGYDVNKEFAKAHAQIPGMSDIEVLNARDDTLAVLAGAYGPEERAREEGLYNALTAEAIRRGILPADDPDAPVPA
jgi:hypothetical protein